MIVKQAQPGSPLHRALAGEGSEWGLRDYLLAAAVDALNGANWQRGGSKGPRPKPIPRPGMAPPKDETRWGTVAVSLDEMADWLARRNPNQARLN